MARTFDRICTLLGEMGYLSDSGDLVTPQGENLRRNVDRFAPLRDLAAELSLTPAQLALAWLLHQGDDIVPIPGTRSTDHLATNVAAADARLDAASLARIDEVAPAELAQGAALVGPSA